MKNLKRYFHLRKTLESEKKIMKTYNFVMNLNAYDLNVSVNAETNEEAIELAEINLLESLNLLNHDVIANVVSVSINDDSTKEFV